VLLIIHLLLLLLRNNPTLIVALNNQICKQKSFFAFSLSVQADRPWDGFEGNAHFNQGFFAQS